MLAEFVFLEARACQMTCAVIDSGCRECGAWAQYPFSGIKVFLLPPASGPWHAATLSTVEFKLAAICVSVCPAATCVFTTSQSTGTSAGANIEHPESPTAIANNPDALEIQRVLRTFRAMILLPAKSKSPVQIALTPRVHNLTAQSYHLLANCEI